MPATPQEISDQSACMACVPDPWAALLYLYSNGMTPQQIATAAACYECIPNKQAAMLYLLALRAGQTDPAVIADQARCFQCVPDQMAALLYLSEQITMNCTPFATTTPADYDINSAFGYMTNSQNFPGLLGLTFQPSSTIAGYNISSQTALLSLIFQNLQSLPASAAFTVSGNSVLNTISAPVLVTIAAPLVTFTGVALTTLSFPALTTTTGWTMSSMNVLTTLSLPALTSITSAFNVLVPSLTTVSLPVLLTTVGLLSFGNNSAINSFSAPLLNSLGGGITLSGTLLNALALPSLTTCGVLNFTMANNTQLTSLSLPLLATAGRFSCTGNTGLLALSLPSLTGLSSSVGINFSGATSLVTVSLPVYVPTNGQTINFGTCALNQASVDGILALCVANPAYVSGTILLNGGTNAAPGVQGALDKTTLIGRGCSVTTN